MVLNNKQIKDLRSGDRVEIKLMIFQVSKGVTNKGAPYLSFQLQDSTGDMDAKYWNVSEPELDKYKAGMICKFKADILLHNNQLQIRIAAIEVLDQNTEDISNYVRSSTFSKQELKYKVQTYIDSLKNPVYRKVVKGLLDECEDDFYVYPAASKNHHNFVGGLATHVLGMLELGKYMCSQYPLLDEDLLISGILMHDIGKIVELSGPVIIEYTTEGKLLGHISIMQAKIYEIARRLELDQTEEVTLLRHMVLSHHGAYEFGSPVLPMIPEAEILNMVDNIDAKMNTMEKALDRVEPGTFTPRIFAMENRQLYKAKNK
ncbi:MULTISPECIES: HD domain-containing protein [Breznakia]|uniref:3'-5' exoribonuclease n=1 Tax=Breznakia blatticola TaxID=1754012 RepID=A0A4R8A6D8_9FIRM|nr:MULTISPECIES: HD domain-containing protein [Breznakia]MDH6367972.1 3'-5' exoribonuclease [Breznakia sp. PH1-1]MDH6405060.1 3'-5' exoribonuclease [Breznakia sp. PF1-11]MDH6412771.1 3'-5' exoribonuclease [Breznakia sp. PFB1-11]MDH6415135.1 3'-5' exoribonuclease [Breznakia sp. PFB1-14]MDH6417442.1 3'-5' exoribonuclease [Breznakia sp. PFB1-4]